MNRFVPELPSSESRREHLPGRVLLSFGLMIVAAALAVASAAPAADKPAVVIKMTDKPPVYIPAKVTIKVGQTVEWVNNASTLHDVNADASSVQNTKDVSLPPGAKPFDSGFMRPGMTFDYTFTVPGTYRYTCVPHEKDGMNGTVVVKK
jgi:plastocyanin